MRILALSSQPLKQLFVLPKFGIPKPMNALNQILQGDQFKRDEIQCEGN